MHRAAILLPALAAAAALTAAPALAGPKVTRAPACGEPTDHPPAGSSGGVAGLGHYLYWIGGTNGAPATWVRRFQVKTRRWENLPELHGDRIHPAVAALGGRLVVVGGMGMSLTGMADVQVFDPGSCGWSDLAQLPSGVAAAAATTVGDRVVVVGGNVDNHARSWQGLEIWSSEQAIAVGADGGLDARPALTVSRSDGAAVTVGDTVWMLGGRHHLRDEDTIGGSTDEVETLAAGAKAWSSGPPLPFRAEVFAAARRDGTIVVFGRDVLFRMEPAILTKGAADWRLGKPRPATLEFLEGAAVVDGTIYVLGHTVGRGDEPDVYRVASYDPGKDRWTIVSTVQGQANGL